MKLPTRHQLNKPAFFTKSALILGLTLMMFLALATACRRTGKETGSPAKTPDIYTTPLRTLDGKNATLTSYQGKILLLNFWATWCGPCREDMPDLDNFYQKYRNLGLVVVGVSLDSDRSDARDFIKEIGIQYPIYWDGMDGPLAKSLGGIFALPTTFLFDSNGKLVKKIVGPRTLKEFEAILRPYLGKTGA